MKSSFHSLLAFISYFNPHHAHRDPCGPHFIKICTCPEFFTPTILHKHASETSLQTLHDLWNPSCEANPLAPEACPLYTEQNDLDRNLDPNTDQEIVSSLNTCPGSRPV